MLRVFQCLVDHHDPRLVVLAALICFLASFTAAALMSRAQACSGKQRLFWIGAAAVEFGCGVWSLHFVAMLAFMPGMPISYDLAPTLWSVVIAMLGSFGGFLLAAAGRRDPVRVVGAAAMLTLAIGGMHYTGVAAMRLDGSFRLDPGTVACSVGTSAAFCIAAVISMGQLRTVGRQGLTTLLLSIAICALHFVGMAAMDFQAGESQGRSGMLLGSSALAFVVAMSGITLVLLSLALSIVDRLLCDRACEEKARLRKLTAISFEGLIIERGGLVVDANERLGEFSGYALADIIGKPIEAILSAAGASHGDATTWPAGGDHVLRRACGNTMPVELLVQSIALDGREATAIAIRDLTARRAGEAALHRLAHYDALTGLANRVLLDTRMHQAFEEPHRPVRFGAVLCLDLDRFKPVNDLLGHAMGDKLLIAVSLRLGALLRQSDTLARVGGDEFTILMPDAGDIAACRSLASRIVQSMLEPFRLDDQQVVVGVSIGIALCPQDGDKAEELLRCADIALYRSKEEGRGTYRLFEARMDAELQHRRALERDLRAAIDQKDLELHYQPLVNGGTGQVEGYEALLRWHHPTRGFVSPATFIPIAEESGLILPLGQWVLETACAAAAAWDVPRRVAVNLSPAQFKQTDLIERIMGALDQTGLSADRLEIEVTEGVLINKPERAIVLLSSLRSSGVRVSLDDFGTGYSSLSYLRQFPLDKIKIDRSFISDLGIDEKSTSIVRAVITLAHSLGLSVTAEGVETREQFDLLRLQLCDQVQGYLLGRPGPLEQPGTTSVAEDADRAQAGVMGNGLARMPAPAGHPRVAAAAA